MPHDVQTLTGHAVLDAPVRNAQSQQAEAQQAEAQQAEHNRQKPAMSACKKFNPHWLCHVITVTELPIKLKVWV